MKFFKVPIVALLSCLLTIPVVQLANDVDIRSSAIYKDGTWSGNVVCDFYQQSNCALSIHVHGRRIDFNTEKSNENLFVSCQIPTTSIGLTISNFTYDDVQDYSCLQDITQQYNHTWISPNPYIEVEGNSSVGSVVKLTCNSVPGAPLYWVLPGDSQNNTDVEITDTSNQINSSTTAIFTLTSEDDGAEYKCCVRIKDGQYPIPCTTQTFVLNGNKSASYQLASFYYKYTNPSSMIMTCIIEGDGRSKPNYNVSWYEYHTDSYWRILNSNYFTTIVDFDSFTVNTTLTIGYDDYYPTYKCFYEGQPYHTFKVSLGTQYIKVLESERHIYYSDEGYAVTLSCSVDSSGEPTINWTIDNILNFANGSETITTGGSYSITTRQTSTTNWLSTLAISPYNPTVHNAFYTCRASNALGHSSVRMNATEEPSNMDLKLLSNVTNGTETIRAVCTFRAFPNPPNYIINVITAEAIAINTTTVYDDRQLNAMVFVDFKANIGLFPATIECTATNPVVQKQLTSRIFIDTTPHTSTQF